MEVVLYLRHKGSDDGVLYDIPHTVGICVLNVVLLCDNSVCPRVLQGAMKGRKCSSCASSRIGDKSSTGW